MLTRMVERTRHYRTATKDALTPRQCEVLDLVVAGKTNPEIAEKLGITLDGAKFHIREILSKLEVHSREEAAEWWMKNRGLGRRMASWVRALTPVGLGRPVAIATALGGTTFGLAATLLAVNGGGHTSPERICGITDIKSEVRPVASDRGNVYELWLSADEPCRFEGAGWATLNRPPSLPSSSFGRGLLTSTYSANVVLDLDPELRWVGSATWLNECGEFRPGTSLQVNLQRQQDIDRGQGGSFAAVADLGGAPPCEDPNELSRLFLMFDSQVPPVCDPREIAFSGESALSGSLVRFVFSVDSPRKCLLEGPVTVALEESGTAGLLSPSRVDGSPVDVAVNQVLGVGKSPVITGTLWNVCATGQRALSVVMGSSAAYILDVQTPPCTNGTAPAALTATWVGAPGAAGPRTFAATVAPRDESRDAIEDAVRDVLYRVVVVAPGDTLPRIAEQYGVSMAALVEANPDLAAQGLRTGMALRIPLAPATPQ
jgi:DNA-binding CsgD family transcriptional regulator